MHRCLQNGGRDSREVSAKECIDRGGLEMFDKTRKVMTGASTGIAVAAAFMNVALLIVQLVKTVSEDKPQAEEK